ncbi:MAG: hypothetical protein IKY83_10705 [Proteobacteria bacterium]|nr:hypothetical protein [Pseudomonadota bacterium]
MTEKERPQLPSLNKPKAANRHPLPKLPGSVPKRSGSDTPETPKALTSATRLPSLPNAAKASAQSAPSHPDGAAASAPSLTNPITADATPKSDMSDSKPTLLELPTQFDLPTQNAVSDSKPAHLELPPKAAVSDSKPTDPELPTKAAVSDSKSTDPELPTKDVVSDSKPLQRERPPQSLPSAGKSSKPNRAEKQPRPTAPPFKSAILASTPKPATPPARAQAARMNTDDKPARHPDSRTSIGIPQMISAPSLPSTPRSRDDKTSIGIPQMMMTDVQQSAIPPAMPKRPSAPPASPQADSQPKQSAPPTLPKSQPKPGEQPKIRQIPKPPPKPQASDTAPTPAADAVIASNTVKPPKPQTATSSATQNAVIPADTASQKPQIAQTAAKPSDSNSDLPQAWLEGKTSPIKETAFSTPNIIPETHLPSRPRSNPAVAGSVDLEVNENIPDELKAIIAGYDDEIRYASTRDSVRECAIQLTIARTLEYTGYEKLAYVRYLKALEVNHYSRTAIHELRRIARAYNKTRDVTTLLQSELDTDTPSDQQAALLEECGIVTFFGLENQRIDAINMLYRAASLAPQSLSPVCTLIYMLLFERRYSECCEMIDRLVALTEDKQTKISCHCIRGDIESGLDAGHTSGLESYLRALELAPGSLYAFHHAMAIFLRQDNYQALYQRTNAFAKETKDKVIGHAALLLSAGIANDILSDGTAAAQAYDLALKYIPNDTMPLELQLENTISDPTKYQVTDKLLIDLIRATQIPRERIELSLLRAVNLDLNAGAVTEALEILQSIVQNDNQDRLILEYYQSLLLKNGRMEDATQLQKRFAELSNTEEAAAKFASLGCYCIDVLNKHNEAEQNFLNALSLDPTQRTAFEYLEQMLRLRNDYEGIARLYRARLNVTSDARTRASLLYTLATLCDYNLAQPDNAIAYYQQYREIFPDDICAIHNLERLFQKTKNWKSQIAMLLIEKETSASPVERSELLMRIATICRFKLNKSRYAINFLYLAKQENPNSISVLRELSDILREARSWKELVSVLNELLRLQTDNESKTATLYAIAQIQENMICDTNEAVACYARILAISPDNILAKTKLAAIYRHTNNLVAYYELAVQQARRISQPANKAKHLFKVAIRVLTRFRNVKKALEILEMAYASDPTYTPAVFLLTLLYGTEVRFDSLIPILQDYTNAVKAQSTKAACSLTLAYLYAWQLKSPDDAIHPLELALALDPQAMNARFMLIMAQHARGQYTEIAPLFTEGAQCTQDPKLAIHDNILASYLAHAYPSAGNAFDNEVSTLKSVIEVDPDNLIANERLESMEPNRTNLIPFIEKRLKHATGDDRTELQLALAESIYPDQPQKAFATLCEIVETNPTHLPALRVASNMANKLGDHNLYARFLAMQAQCLENIQTRIETWKLAAEIAQNQLNNTDLAIENYKQAFMLAPQSTQILDELIKLLKNKHDIAAIDSLMQIHTRAITKEDQPERYLQMADIYLNEFKEPQQAVVKYKQALELQHNNVEVLQKLAQVELSLHHWHEARNALEQIIEYAENPSEIRLSAQKELANLFIYHTATPQNAVPLLQDVLINDPNDIAAIEKLADIYLMDSKLNEALALLLRANHIVKPPQNIQILIKIANIYKALGNTEKQMNVMKDAAAIVKLDPAILSKLQAWLAQCSDPIILRTFTEKLLELDDIPDTLQVKIYEFAANCYGGPLNMRFEADKYALAAVRIAPNSLQMQLLAARVFDPKEAMIHANAAAQIAPFSIEPYSAMLDIATNSNRIDLQARVEQQLLVLGAQFTPNAQLQNAYIQRFPYQPGCIDDAILHAATTIDLNPNILDLLKLTNGHTQIFERPHIAGEPISIVQSYAALFKDVAEAFNVTGYEAQLVPDMPAVFSLAPDDPHTIQFNLTTLNIASEPERRFHMAAAMTHLRLGTMPLIMYPPENIAMLISGILGIFDDKVTTPNILNTVKSFLPRNIRKAVLELVSSRGLAAFQYDPAQLQFAAANLDANIGHVFSADLTASVAALIRRKVPNTQLPTNPQQWHAYFAKTPGIRNILLFNTSERFSEIRQKLGIFIRPLS